MTTTTAPAAIDAALLQRLKEFGERAFGPGPRTAQHLEHLRKELKEIADPSDLTEWVDAALLAFGGAMRMGHDPQAVIDGVYAKLAINEGRTWPDWRTADPEKPIEHVEEDAHIADTRASSVSPPQVHELPAGVREQLQDLLSRPVRCGHHTVVRVDDVQRILDSATGESA